MELGQRAEEGGEQRDEQARTDTIYSRTMRWERNGQLSAVATIKGRNCCTDGEEEGTVWCEWERKGKGKQTDGSDTVAHCESSGRAEPGCRWRSALEQPCGGCEDVKKSRG
jgi:hypothetical protein